MSTATASLVMTFVGLLIPALAATYVKTRNGAERLGILFTFLGGLDLIVVNVFELHIYARAGTFGPEDNVFFVYLCASGSLCICWEGLYLLKSDSLKVNYGKARNFIVPGMLSEILFPSGHRYTASILCRLCGPCVAKLSAPLRVRCLEYLSGRCLYREVIKPAVGYR